MKRVFFSIIPVFMLILNCGGSPKTVESVSEKLLDKAIAEAAARIDSVLQQVKK